MGRTSKDLLSLEHKISSAVSSFESTLLVCKKDTSSRDKQPDLDKKLVTASLPQSQVLDKVKDFLGVISEANKRLELNAEDKSADYDIEALTGNESEIIEMDLMLGVADLHTLDAVAAAESAISGNQLVIPLPESSGNDSCETESDDCWSDDDGGDVKACFPDKRKSCESKQTEVNKTVGKNKSKKRARVVELS